IVYCLSKAQTELVMGHLIEDCGVPCVVFHAGLQFTERMSAFERWRTGDAPVIVCTTAFGEAIDVASVRFVIHIASPRCMIDKVQEDGRAGRDGRPALVYTVYSK
ncbi:P-loop containing nucleoside triphosphate hydrolase protein, partial [Calocera cornea HHB12733]